MARSDNRGSREAKKPKKPKAAEVAPAAVTSFAAVQKKILDAAASRKK
ncbi:MAG: hypothetical protein K2X45_13225 [Phreatobacter sp.]|jgi:hypothetical protein|nr:hypothetical protein [Phreatobacter sp.]